MRAAWLCLVLAACGDSDGADAPVDTDPAMDAAPPRETLVETQPLEAGELVEGIMHGGPSDYAIIRLTGPTPSIDWNLHGHQNGGTQMLHEELGKMTVEYRFVPASEGDWYLLLRNGGSTNMDVEVRVEMYGALSWRWQ